MTIQIFRYKGTIYSLNEGDELVYCDRMRWYKLNPKHIANYEPLFNELRKGFFSLFIIRKGYTSTTILERSAK